LCTWLTANKEKLCDKNEFELAHEATNHAKI
jgi:hypothetical protein